MPGDTDTDKDKLNRLERLKAKLFSKSYQTKIEYRDSLSDPALKDIHETWDDSNDAPKETRFEKFFKQSSVFKKFFIFSIGFFVLALLYVGYMIFWGGNTVSNDNIEISIFGNTFANGGEPLPLKIEIVNRNSSPLELVDLVVEYPRGSEGDLSQDTERLRSSLGKIEPGGVVNESAEVILFGQQGSVRPVRVSIEYRVEGSNSIFVKEKIYEVSIDSAPIEISMSAPNEITPNQDITLTAKAVLNAPRSVDNLLLRFDYPIGFQFTTAVPAPSLGNNVWDLGEMKPGEERDIIVTGRMTEVFDGEEKTFHVSSGLQSKSDKSLIDVVYNSLAHTVLIERPFIDLNLTINGDSKKEYAVASKAPIIGQISWSNNLDIPVSDLRIEAKFSGNALNRHSIDSDDGFYSSSTDTIIWDKNTEDEFGRVDPGALGGVGFSLKPSSLVTPQGDLLTQPTIVVEVSVVGKQLLEGNIVRELRNSETKIIKVTTEANFSSKILHYSGPFENTGPIPPKAESETTYTVVWGVSNTSNNLSRAEVKTSIPSWVRFIGEISPADEDLVYNSATREITWRPGTISRGAGMVGPAREVSFQIALLPSLSQVGSMPILLNKAVFNALDTFSNAAIQINKVELNTNLLGDPQFEKEVQARVIE